jgi:hypothetical protein
MKYKAQCGDIFLCDSDRSGAKVVKFLMTAPTIWHWIYRQIRGTQESVRFYHSGMIISDKQMIEQQWKVQYGETQKILNRKIIIYRNKTVSNISQHPFRQMLLYNRATEDLDKTYDILQLIGKTLTWFTGIKLFVRFLGNLSKEQEICVTRIGDWYDGICNFGIKTKHEMTTKIIDEYCQCHPNEWEIVYYN